MKKDTLTQVVFLDEAMKVDISSDMIVVSFPPSQVSQHVAVHSAFIHTLSAFV